MPLNLTHLAAFQAAAETRSVTLAGAKLMVSQPAISKQIQLLERELGVRLFDRHARGVRLTGAGEMLAQYSRVIFDSAADAERALTETRQLRRGRLAIGASTTIATYLLPEVFVAFRRAFPGIKATIDVSNSATICQRVAERGLAVGFVETNHRVPGINARQFFSDQLIGIASPSQPLGKLGKASIQVLCREPFVVRETGSESKSFVERALAARKIFVDPVMSLPSTEAIKRAVAAGIGVAIVSRLSIAVELKANLIAPVVLTDMKIRRPLYCVTPARQQPGPALSAFLELLSARLVH